jgi:hypothetical protein
MAKKHGKIKLPKRVAGIRIPKVIRKGPLGQFLNSHAGQVILAEAVVAAAAIFTAKTAEDSAVGDGLRHPVDGARRLKHAMAATSADQSERLAHAFRRAGEAFREALHDGYAGVWQDRRDIGSDEEEEAPRAKKSSARDSHDTHH